MKNKKRVKRLKKVKSKKKVINVSTERTSTKEDILKRAENIEKDKN